MLLAAAFKIESISAVVSVLGSTMASAMSGLTICVLFLMACSMFCMWCCSCSVLYRDLYSC